ncbi:MAG: YqeG family HAD IIIA-type phosphatase [Oscillospiraceae bacterium]|nr:YqeG family HAD IIIA-type phosphatase [Oscillospiraceae bacterium]
MAISLLPDYCCGSIYEVAPEKLRALGVTLLLADLDNTLVSYDEALPSERLRAYVKELQQTGVDLFLLSNSRKPVRPKRFAEALDIPYLGHAGKPKTGGYKTAMERMNRTAAETMMVGDQVFTDVLGAKRAGVRVILLRPIRLAGNPGRYLRYGVEMPMRLIRRRRTL